MDGSKAAAIQGAALHAASRQADTEAKSSGGRVHCVAAALSVRDAGPTDFIGDAALC